MRLDQPPQNGENAYHYMATPPKFTSAMLDLIARQHGDRRRQAVYIVLCRALAARKRRGRYAFPMCQQRLADLVGWSDNSAASRLLNKLLGDGHLTMVSPAKIRKHAARYELGPALPRRHAGILTAEQVAQRFGLLSEQSLLTRPDVQQRIDASREKANEEKAAYRYRQQHPYDGPTAQDTFRWSRGIRKQRKRTEKALNKLRAAKMADPTWRLRPQRAVRLREQRAAEKRLKRFAAMDHAVRIARLRLKIRLDGRKKLGRPIQTQDKPTTV
jgi:hypothetical protein